MHIILSAVIGFLIGAVLKIAIPIFIIMIVITGAVLCNA